MIDWSLATSLNACVFPLRANSKKPAIDWDTYKLGTRASPAQIAEWQARGWQPAIPTNPTNGIVIFDIDSLMALIEADSRGLPSTFTVKTPNGWHYYFQHPGWAVSNRAAVKFEGERKTGWDVRGDKGYVAGPGCYFIPDEAETAAGKMAGPYIVENDAPIAPLPEWLAELMRPVVHAPAAPAKFAETTSPWGYKALHACLELIADAVPGTVNDTINHESFRIAQAVAGGEIVSEEAYEAIREALVGRGLPDDDRAYDAFERAWLAGLEAPRAGPPTLTALDAFGPRSEVPDPPGDPSVPVPPPPSAYGPPVAFLGQVYGEGIETYFAGCTYVSTDNAIWVPGGVLLKQQAFNAVYGGPRFSIGAQGDKPTKSAWDCYTLNEVKKLPRAHRTCFRPECAPGAILTIEGLPMLNAYVPIAVPRMVGDVSPFLNHVRKMLPDGRDAEYLLHWMASAVQNPGAKFQWWPVIQGTKGNGKTLLLECMMAAIGTRYSHLVNPEAMQKTGGQFNSWIERKLFLGFEEIHNPESRRDFADMMKSTVTNRRIAAEGKGTAQDTVDNRANGMALTNYRDAMPIDDDERRWGIFWCAQQTAEHLERDSMVGRYFPDLYEWLRADGFAIVAQYLATRPLSPDMDPARDQQRAPDTSSTAGAKRESYGNAELEVLEAIEQGQHGFCGGFVSSEALRPIMDRMRVGRKRWKSLLATLGYEPHPALGADGRVPVALADGKKPRLYALRDHPTASLSAHDVGPAYEAAQSPAPSTTNVVAFQRP